jgi:hypothetical protein
MYVYKYIYYFVIYLYVFVCMCILWYCVVIQIKEHNWAIWKQNKWVYDLSNMFVSF